MTSPLSVVRNYLDLTAAFRDRIRQLGISYETLDALAGWTDTYATKLLGPEPIKNMGPMSFDAVLGALGLQLLVVEDAGALDRIRRHRDFVPHGRPQRAVRAIGKHGYVVHRITREQLRQIASSGGLARASKLSSTRRVALARKAARARWDKA